MFEYQPIYSDPPTVESENAWKNMLPGKSLMKLHWRPITDLDKSGKGSSPYRVMYSYLISQDLTKASLNSTQ